MAQNETTRLTPRLTKPQREFLAELAKAPRGAWHKYSPALKLVELGLATSGDGRYGTVRFTITDAGRSAL